jgi:hypothetical protein
MVNIALMVKDKAKIGVGFGKIGGEPHGLLKAVLSGIEITGSQVPIALKKKGFGFNTLAFLHLAPS